MNRRIKAMMALKGVKGVDIARRLHVSPVTVSIIVTGRGKSRRVQRAIAAALHMSVTELWPDNNKAA